MSETRGNDPLRRKPPTIDLPSTEFTRSNAADPAAADEGATAIEPVASTALGRDPFAKTSGGPAPGGGAAASVPKGDEPKPEEEVKPSADTSPASGKQGAGDRPGSADKPAGGAKSAKRPESVSSPTKPMPAAGSPSGPPTTSKPGVTSPGQDSSRAGRGDAPAAGGDIAKAGTPKQGMPAGAAPKVGGSPAATPSGDAATSKPKPSESGPGGTGTARSAIPDASGRSPETSRPSGPGSGRMLASGLVGGLLGAGLLYGATRLLPASGPDSGLGERLTTLERRIAALPASGSGMPLEPRIGALETGLRQAGEDARAARTAAEAASRQAVEALGRPAAAPVDSGLSDAVKAVGARVDEIAKQVGAQTGAIGDLGTRLQALGRRTDEGLAAGSSGLQAAQGVLQGVRADVGAMRTGATALEGRTAEGEKRIAGLSEDLARLSGELAKLSPAAVQAGLRVVVAGRLDDALRAGTPLGPALAALSKLGADPGSTAALRPFVESAPPSAGALAAEFKPLAAHITAQPDAPAETWVDKVRRLFGKVVTVRAVGDGSGSDLPGLVSRIEAALARASLSEAAALWEQLPDAARRLSADWAGRLKSRVAAEDAARRLVTQSLSALDAATR